MRQPDPAGVLEGVYVANVTPFSDDERFGIDVDAYPVHVRRLAEQGSPASSRSAPTATRPRSPAGRSRP